MEKAAFRKVNLSSVCRWTDRRRAWREGDPGGGVFSGPDNNV